MRRIVLLIAFLATVIMADNSGVEGRVTALENQTTTLEANDVSTSESNTNTLEALNANKELYDSLVASTAATSSVELNPDHTGFSMGVGVSAYHGNTAGAVGMMYAFPKDANGITVGVNIKGFRAEGGAGGASGGITLGF